MFPHKNLKEINYANGRKKKVFIHKKWNEKSKIFSQKKGQKS